MRQPTMHVGCAHALFNLRPLDGMRIFDREPF